MHKSRLGLKGEKEAARYLRDNSYEIIDGNYDTRAGEIDIIVRREKLIVFVEVKSRSEGYIAKPVESVDKIKQQKIVQTAMLYMAVNKIRLQPRFDIIEVYFDNKSDFESLNHIENAF